jgi:hypothetical protein
MKHGHCTGTKRERQANGDPWWAQLAAENLARVEAAWVTPPVQTATPQPKEATCQP